MSVQAKRLYERMRQEMDYEAVLETAVRECGVKSRERAEELLEAFLQWFSLIPESPPEHPLQMLRTVDRIWHAFVLNTKLYRQFCEKFIGGFVDHNPLDVVSASSAKQVYAANTLDLLRQTFGDEVSLQLLELNDDVTCCTGCKSPAQGARRPFQDAVPA